MTLNKTEQQPLNNTKQIFPSTENKEVLCVKSSMSSTQSFDRNLEAIFLDKVSIPLVRESVHLTVSLGTSKTNYLHVSTSSCMQELRN